jgi:hypothetical protein
LLDGVTVLLSEVDTLSDFESRLESFFRFSQVAGTILSTSPSSENAHGADDAEFGVQGVQQHTLCLMS